MKIFPFFALSKQLNLLFLCAIHYLLLKWHKEKRKFKIVKVVLVGILLFLASVYSVFPILTFSLAYIACKKNIWVQFHNTLWNFGRFWISFHMLECLQTHHTHFSSGDGMRQMNEQQTASTNINQQPSKEDNNLYYVHSHFILWFHSEVWCIHCLLRVGTSVKMWITLCYRSRTSYTAHAT